MTILSQNNAYNLIKDRVSTPAKDLTEPAPNKDELEKIIQAAVSVPDHGALVPYRFIVVEGDARQTLSGLFIKALKHSQPNVPSEKVKKQAEKPLRSPMIIVAIAVKTENSAIPIVEQRACANAATMQMMLAANALNFGTIWLTGDFCYDWIVKQGLGLNINEEIMGFVYLGTAKNTADLPKRPNPPKLVTYWVKENPVKSKY